MITKKRALMLNIGEKVLFYGKEAEIISEIEIHPDFPEKYNLKAQLKSSLLSQDSKSGAIYNITEGTCFHWDIPGEEEEFTLDEKVRAIDSYHGWGSFNRNDPDHVLEMCRRKRIASENGGCMSTEKVNEKMAKLYGYKARYYSMK